ALIAGELGAGSVDESAEGVVWGLGDGLSFRGGRRGQEQSEQQAGKRAPHIALLSRLDVHVLDYVAQVPGRIPERRFALRLTDRVDSANHDAMGPGCPWEPNRAPVAEGVAPEVRTQARALPGRAAIIGHQDFSDAVAAVEGDSLESYRLPDCDSRARL